MSALDGQGASSKRRAWLLFRFDVMALCFGMALSVDITIRAYTTVLLGKEQGNLAMAATYVACTAGTLLSYWLMKRMGGAFRVMVAAQVLCSIYPVLFGLAAHLYSKFPTSPLVSVFALTGSCAGGFGMGLLWPAQGMYYSKTVAALARILQLNKTHIPDRTPTGKPLVEAEVESIDVASNELAGRFGRTYICVEITVMVVTLPLSFYDHRKKLYGIFILYGILSFLCVFGHLWNGEFWLHPIATGADDGADDGAEERTEKKGSEKGECRKCLGVLSLWANPQLWLLSVTAVSFGVTLTYLLGFLNAQVVAPALGKQYIGLLGAVQSLVTVFACWLYGTAFPAIFKEKGPGAHLIVSFTMGSICFCLVPFFVQV
jgi:hypothetical protein